MERGKLVGLNLVFFVLMIAMVTYFYYAGIFNGDLNQAILRSPSSRNILIAIGIGFIIVLILWIITFKNLMKESHIMMKM